MTKCFRVGTDGFNYTIAKAAFCPFAMVCFGVWFICREIEVSGALASELSFSEQGRRMYIFFPASKKGTEAKGITRTLDCLCGVTEFCPVHLLSRHVEELKKHFVVQLGLEWRKLPLFPRADGNALSKEAVVSMLTRLVASYGGRTVDHLGRSCISGHTMRITGAQLLASLGLDPVTIGMHGRWSSNAILTYLGESPLSSVSARLKQHTQLALPLRELTERVAQLEEVFVSDSESEQSSSSESSDS